MRIDLDVDDVRALLDIATNSMDFSSGFLDNEEVEVMRRVAMQLGIDPNAATPYTFKASFKHHAVPFDGWEYDWTIDDPVERGKSKVLITKCRECGKPVEHEAHDVPPPPERVVLAEEMAINPFSTYTEYRNVQIVIPEGMTLEEAAEIIRMRIEAEDE